MTEASTSGRAARSRTGAGPAPPCGTPCTSASGSPPASSRSCSRPEPTRADSPPQGRRAATRVGATLVWAGPRLALARARPKSKLLACPCEHAREGLGRQEASGHEESKVGPRLTTVLADRTEGPSHRFRTLP